MRRTWRRRESTEIAARSNWKKAQIELDHALGDLLEKNHIELDDAIRGKLPVGAAVPAEWGGFGRRTDVPHCEAAVTASKSESGATGP